MFRRFVAYLGPRPAVRDLWTYGGVWILCGVFTGVIHRFVFLDLFGWTHWLWFGVSGALALLIEALLLATMGFSAADALVTAAGGMCIALSNWPTLNTELPLWQRLILTIGGIIVSLPPFTRGMVEFHKRNQKT